VSVETNLSPVMQVDGLRATADQLFAWTCLFIWLVGAGVLLARILWF
jgi:hypothetical protein